MLLLVLENNAVWGSGGLKIGGSESAVTLLNNVHITSNSSNSGAGIKIGTGISILDNVTITNNIADEGGIGIPKIGGGGIDISNATLYLLNSTVNNNSSGTNDYDNVNGGGIGAYNSILTIENTTLTGNTSTGNGGGISTSNSKLIIRNSTISSNTSDDAGGGVSHRGDDEAIFYNCVFQNNVGTVGGGLMTEGLDVVVSESIFRGNSCNERGSAIDLYGNGDYIISNSTFIQNSTTVNQSGEAAVIYFDQWPENTTPSIRMQNSILWDNDIPSFLFMRAHQDTLMIDYSIIEGGIDSINAVGNQLIYGSNNLDQDPLFSDINSGDYTLQSGSPAIDVGNPNAFYNDDDGSRNDMGYTGGNGIHLSATEIDFGYVGVGDSRNKTITISNLNPHDIAITGASFDDSQFTTNQSFPLNMAYYSSADIQFTFTPTSTGAHADTLQLSSDNIPGDATYGEFALSGNAFDLSDGVVEVPGEVPTIQEAIDASSDGDTVLVAAGTYYENIEINGKYIALIGADSATTILDGGNTNGVLSLGYDNGGVSLIKRFTIQNGNRSPGGGIVINHSNAVLDELIIQNNESTNNGGAIIAWDWDGSLTNSIVQNNYSGNEGALNISNGSDLTQSGGGMSVESGCSVTMDNVEFYYNSSSFGSGGAFWCGGQIFAINCQFAGNSASWGGVGWISNNRDPEPMFINCNFRGNTAQSGNGGAFYILQGTDVLFYNCRFLFNTANTYGGAIIVQSGATPQIINTTIAGNTAGQGGGGIYYDIQSSSVAKIENSIIWGNSPDMISFVDDPVFGYSKRTGWNNKS